MSNIDALKIVFSLVERGGPETFEHEGGADPSVDAVRQLYSVESRIYPAQIQEVDLREIISQIPQDFSSLDAAGHRRLVVTLTE